jgi:hypothetical protein
MTIYKCNVCSKEFNRKCNYNDHINKKKKPCIITNENNLTRLSISESIEEMQKNTVKEQNIVNNLKNTEEIIDLMFREPVIDDTNGKIVCIYCEKIFTRMDSLKKHQNARCKSKVHHDEFEILQEKINIVIQNYQKLENENTNLKNKIDKIELTQKDSDNPTKTNITNQKTINNTNSNNNVNNGIINTINIVQFGEEDISKLNLPEAVKQYLVSTGGNIASNMLKYINLNEKYPENHNICITDISRELVKIHNGKKFITKKFKNVKNDIMKNIVKNTRKIMDNYEKDNKIKKSPDTNTKIKINEVSLKLIDGVSGEEIVREEIKEKDKLEKFKDSKKDNDNADSESEDERDFTFEERMRIEHLEKKREGLQMKTFENLKEELYNARELLLKK